jgi:hypothetical protein
MTAAKALYKEDFYGWTQQQAGALRELAASRWSGPLDLANRAAEVADLGASERNAVLSQLERVLQHLLDLEHSRLSEPRNGWLNSVDAGRAEIERRLSPAMRPEVEARFDRLFAQARMAAARDLHSHGEEATARALTELAPYMLDQTIDED